MKIAGFVGSVSGFVLGAMLSFLLNGIVVKLLWEWFMTPTLNLPTISVSQAIGIGMLITYLTHHHIPRNKNELIEALRFQYSLFAFVIVAGWALHRYFM